MNTKLTLVKLAIATLPNDVRVECTTDGMIYLYSNQQEPGDSSLFGFDIADFLSWSQKSTAALRADVYRELAYRANDQNYQDHWDEDPWTSSLGEGDPVPCDDCGELTNEENAAIWTQALVICKQCQNSSEVK